MTDDNRRWLRLAAAILAAEGILTLLCSGFVPSPILPEIGLSVPILGRLTIFWSVVGAAYLAAAAGVASRRRWGRALAVVMGAVGMTLVTKPDAQRRRTANPSSPVDASTARRCGSAVPTPGIVVRGWLADALARVAKIVGSTGVATTISMLARAWDEGADYSER